MARLISRRTYLKQIATVAAASALPATLGSVPMLAFGDGPPPTPTEAELAAMDQIARDFMNKCRVPALSLAIARHGQFVYRKAFGWADQDKGERATASNLCIAAN